MYTPLSLCDWVHFSVDPYTVRWEDPPGGVQPVCDGRPPPSCLQSSVVWRGPAQPQVDWWSQAGVQGQHQYGLFHPPQGKFTVRSVGVALLWPRPQDTHLLDFMSRYYELNPRLGSVPEEKVLGVAIDSLRGANHESLVQFLHITLNNLSSLLVRPTVTEESADIPGKAFEGMVGIVQRVQRLDLPTDKHSRNGILSSYVQYVFSAPMAQYSPGAFDSRTATLKGRLGSAESGEFTSAASAASAAFKKGGSVRGTKGVSFSGESVCECACVWVVSACEWVWLCERVCLCEWWVCLCVSVAVWASVPVWVVSVPVCEWVCLCEWWVCLCVSGCACVSGECACVSGGCACVSGECACVWVGVPVWVVSVFLQCLLQSTKMLMLAEEDPWRRYVVFFLAPSHPHTLTPSHPHTPQLFHEELVLQWIVAHPTTTRPLVLKNAWFFFEILVSFTIITPSHITPSHCHTLTDQEHGQPPQSGQQAQCSSQGEVLREVPGRPRNAGWFSCCGHLSTSHQGVRGRSMLLVWKGVCVGGWSVLYVWVWVERAVCGCEWSVLCVGVWVKRAVCGGVSGVCCVSLVVSVCRTGSLLEDSTLV